MHKSSHRAKPWKAPITRTANRHSTANTVLNCCNIAKITRADLKVALTHLEFSGRSWRLACELPATRHVPSLRCRKSSPISKLFRPPLIHRATTQPPRPPRAINFTGRPSITRYIHRARHLDEVIREIPHPLRVNTTSYNRQHHLCHGGRRQPTRVRGQHQDGRGADAFCRRHCRTCRR